MVNSIKFCKYRFWFENLPECAEVNRKKLGEKNLTPYCIVGCVSIILPLILTTHLPLWEVFLTHSTDEENEAQRENWFPKVWNRAVNLFPRFISLISSASIRHLGVCETLWPKTETQASQTSSGPNKHNSSERLWCLPCPQRDFFVSWILTIYMAQYTTLGRALDIQSGQ